MIGSLGATVDGQYYWIMFMAPYAVWDMIVHGLAVWMTGNVAVFTAAMVNGMYERGKRPYLDSGARKADPFAKLGFWDGLITIFIILFLSAPIIAYYATSELIKAFREGVHFNFKISRTK